MATYLAKFAIEIPAGELWPTFLVGSSSAATTVNSGAWPTPNLGQSERERDESKLVRVAPGGWKIWEPWRPMKTGDSSSPVAGSSRLPCEQN